MEKNLATETATTNTTTTLFQQLLGREDFSSKGPMTRDGESLREASSPISLLTTKTKTRIGTWNIRTLYESGKLAQVTSEMERYNMKVLGLCETRWNGSGQVRVSSGETIIYSGHKDADHAHTQGVAIMLAPEATRALMAWEPVSPRLLTARFNSKGRKITIIQCYAPTNTAQEEEKEDFYSSLQSLFDKTPRRDIKIVMGDLNAKVGDDNTGRELIMGRHGVGTCNENGELFIDFCSFNDLVIGGTIYPHRTIHKTTWTSPDGKTDNQIDHFTIDRKWRRSVLDVRTRRGADAASDHQLLVATMRAKLKAFCNPAGRTQHKFNTQLLRDRKKADEFNCEVKNRFEALAELVEETVENQWSAIQETWKCACVKVLGGKEKEQKEWMTRETWEKIGRRRKVKQEINSCHDKQREEHLRAQYWEVNREVKKSARRDKRLFVHNLTEEAEAAARVNNMKRVYEITRTLSGKSFNTNQPVKDKTGRIITSEEEQRRRWVEHFEEVLNRPPPQIVPDIPLAEEPLNISIDPPTKAEIIKAIKSLKTGKAPGPDGIPPEALKANTATTAEMLHPLLAKIWEQEKVPVDWKRGYLVKLPKKGDLSQCGNWRGIMLVSIPSKVLTRIILERLKEALDERLRPEQAGFRQDRSCTDHIATLRIIIEQSIEWQSPIYTTFVDFEKAFDSVDREIIWKLMQHHGIPQKLINIIKQLYEESSCQIIHKGKLTNPFAVRTGVRQGCMLSPTIFLIVMDWIMRRTTEGNSTGIQWTLTQQLEDLDFADDVSLLSHERQHAQSKLTRLAEEAEKVGLKINTKKTVVMRLNNRQEHSLHLQGEDLIDTNRYVYLGSVVSSDGGADEDAKCRINKARFAFNSLRPIWNSKALSQRSKVRIFNTNVKAVLLYGSETWRVKCSITNKLQTFVNKCLRRILNIRWPEKISNAVLWDRTNQNPVAQDIKKRKWGWIGHTLRKPATNVTRQALEWNPQGKRKVGRPKQTWRRSVESEIKDSGMTWTQLKRAAQDRVRWRGVVAALCSAGSFQD